MKKTNASLIELKSIIEDIERASKSQILTKSKVIAEAENMHKQVSYLIAALMEEYPEKSNEVKPQNLN
jgi:hypothetical protein